MPFIVLKFETKLELTTQHIAYYSANTQKASVKQLIFTMGRLYTKKARLQ
jgi:hypothetical protein